MPGTRYSLPLRSRLMRWTAVNLVLSTGLAALPALAQTQLDPVTSTATKTERKVDEQPFSVDVVGPDDLERIQPQNLNDILRDIPGVWTSGGTRASGMGPNIRGFDGTRVVTTIDGARQNFDAGHKGSVFFDPDMLKQVDVLKGAGSALYGSGAIGGVMAMTTKDAADFLEAGQSIGGRMKFGYSSAYYEPSYNLTTYARAGDSADILASGSYSNSRDYRIGGGGNLPYSAESQPSGLFKIGGSPAEGHRVSVSSQLVNITGTEPINLALNTQLPNEVANRATQMRSYTARWVGNDPDRAWLNPNVVFYRNTIGVTETRLSDGRSDITDLATNGLDARNSLLFSTGSWMKHTLTGGVEYFHDNQTAYRNAAIRGEFPGGTADTTGLYLQDEIKILEQVSLVPGIRWDNFQRNSDTLSVTPLNESKASPRIGATYQPLPWLQFYGSYGQAFRAPSMTELFVVGSHFPGNRFIPNPNLTPETAVTAEGGVRLSFNDVLFNGDGVRFQAGYFDTNATNFINLVVTPTTSTYVNLSKVNLHGTEIEGRYDAPRWFGSLAASQTIGTDTNTGLPIDSVPPEKFVLTLGGKLPEWAATYGWRGEFVAAHDRVAVPTAATPGFATQNLFASWAPFDGPLTGLKVDFAVNNIFDKRYYDPLSTLPEPGRDFRLTVAYAKAY